MPSNGGVFDVKVTRLVHEYGMAHGEVFYHDRLGRKQKVKVEWEESSQKCVAA